MTIDGMPAAEVDINPALVRALLDAQHADLANLLLIEVGAGWDNKMYRLGDDFAVRLPRRAAAAALIEHEQRWLPELAPRLPLPIPVPLRIGKPALGYPWSWSVARWLAGESAAIAPPHDPEAAALALGAFLRGLHQPAPSDAPRNRVRGVPLADRTSVVHDRARQVASIVAGAALLDLWNRLVRTPPWTGPPLWIHGDLHPGNLLVSFGRVSAVIDFGDLCAGDPATDLSIAWMLLPPAARPLFRASARGPGGGVDDDTWARARGWALVLGLAHLANSRDNEIMGALGRATLEAVLRDHF
jgi:aminoglycoside phosphotransferase (APT) family kinase protein